MHIKSASEEIFLLRTKYIILLDYLCHTVTSKMAISVSIILICTRDMIHTVAPYFLLLLMK